MSEHVIHENRGDRMQRELREAIALLPEGTMAAWGRRSAVRLGAISLRRVGGLGKTIFALGKWAWKESKSAVDAGRIRPVRTAGETPRRIRSAARSEKRAGPSTRVEGSADTDTDTLWGAGY